MAKRLARRSAMDIATATVAMVIRKRLPIQRVISISANTGAMRTWQNTHQHSTMIVGKNARITMDNAPMIPSSLA